MEIVGQSFVYANRKGFDIMKTLTDMKRDLQISDGKREESERNWDSWEQKWQQLRQEWQQSKQDMQQRIARLGRETAMLRQEAADARLHDGALAIRRRFFDCYKRDVLNMPEVQHTQNIIASNKVAHCGNAFTDAYLFEHDRRKDASIFSQLYGFEYSLVLAYRKKLSCLPFSTMLIIQGREGIDGGIFSVLNAYATLRVQCVNGHEFSSDFEKAFRSFVTLAEASYPLTPLDDDDKLGKACWEFWRLKN